MTQNAVEPAIEGWYTLDQDRPHLIGSQCVACATYYFPKQALYCRNPNCDSEQFEEVTLSREGTVWSYTNACYQPPEPYIAAQPYEPFTIAAVSLEKEQMIILGQVVAGVTVEDLKVGDTLELVLDTLYTEESVDKLVWKWKPVTKP